MRQRMCSMFALFGGLFFAQGALAQEVTIDLDDSAIEEAGFVVDEIEAQLNDQIAGELHLENYAPYLTYMADANRLASKGMGVDYASNPKLFVVGGSIGTAVTGQGAKFVRGGEGVPEGGFAMQATVMAGLNLGFFTKKKNPLDRFTIYGNWLAFKTKLDPFQAQVSNFGAHLQVALLRPKKFGILKFGGLAVTSGYESASYTLQLQQELPIGEDGLSWDPTGTLTLSSQTGSIPIEVSTNIRLFILSIYGGGGVDIVPSATATGNFDLIGDVSLDLDGDELDVGTAAVTASVSGRGASFAPRAFIGVQINAMPVKLYGQLNVASDKAYEKLGFGGHAGLRIAL